MPSVEDENFLRQMRKRVLRDRNPDFRQLVRDGLGTGPMIFFSKHDYFGVDVSVVLAMKSLLSEPRGPQRRKKKIKPLTVVKSKSPRNIFIYFPVKRGEYSFM